MEYLVIGITALVGSALTFFSGFGLGTILLPVFGLFFPIEIAIALTAIVHFLNNIFKLILVGKKIDTPIWLRFGIPSVIAAFAGALFLTWLKDIPPLFSYSMGGKKFDILPVKLVIALLLLFFSLFEIIPRWANWKPDKKYLPVGGLISGFFGGLSGHQGALRSAYLIRAGLDKESFIATGVAIACLVDVSRLTIYASDIGKSYRENDITLMVVATLSAFVGAFAGNRFLKKMTVRTLQYFVTSLLIIFSILLGIGLV